MKRILLLLSFLFFTCSTDDSNSIETIDDLEESNLVFEGDVYLVGQLEVDAFGNLGYEEITGDLTIVDTQNTPNVVSLESLITLQTIGGELELNSMFDLMSLDGLNNLISIGSLFIFNYFGDSLFQLSNLNSTIERLRLDFCTGLTSLEGLQNINIAEGGIIKLQSNINLVDLNDIQNGIPNHLERFELNNSFQSTDLGVPPLPLNNLDFLINLKSANFFTLHSYGGSALTGLNNIETIGRMSIGRTYYLESLYGFDSLGSINDLIIWTNLSIASLEGLENITTLNDLFILENNNLLSINGLENLINIDGVIEIGPTLFDIGNADLTDFCALQNLFLNGTYNEVNVNINGNGYNPTVQDIIDGNCSL